MLERNLYACDLGNMMMIIIIRICNLLFSFSSHSLGF